MVYKFADGYPVRGMDSQEVGKTLDALNAKHGGITAEIVVKAAKPRKSPMHNAFEWNDVSAAEKYRLTQARFLIKAVVIESEDSPDVRRFVNVIQPNDEGKTLRHFMTLEAAMADDDARAQVLENAKGDMVAFRRRYATLKEVAGVLSAMEQVART